MITDEDISEATELFKSLFKDLFEFSPELIDISWIQFDDDGVFEVSSSMFHIKKEYFEGALEDGATLLRIDKDLPSDHPAYWSVMNSHDLLDLKKNTDLYGRIEIVDRNMLYSKTPLLQKVFGTNVRVVFSAGQFTISPL